MIARLGVLAVLDVFAWVLCVVAAWGPGPALGAHAGLSAVALAIRLRGRPTPGLVVPMLGMFGPLAILAGDIPARRMRPVRSVLDDDRVFGPRATRTARRGHGVAAARLLDGRVRHPAPETLGSLVSILRHGDVPARRRALETVVRSFEPGLSPLIAQALTDRDQTIRALAAAASARVAQNLMLARASFDEAVDAAPPVRGVARLLGDHARANVLLADSQRRKLRDEATAMLPAADPARAGLMLETLWAAGDYAAIDALVASVATTPEAIDGEVVRIARWWRAAATA